MVQAKKHDAYITCNPIIDNLIKISSEQLDELNLIKNSMNLIDTDRYQAIMQYLHGAEVKFAVGGSGMNTAVSLSLLNHNVVFNGKIGTDNNGITLMNLLKEKNVHTSIKKVEGNTATSTILITEDGSRTMNTHLGVSQQFNINDVDFDAIKDSNYVYLTAYSLDTESQNKAIQAVVEHALKHQCKIIWSLSDPLCIKRHHSKLKDYTKDAYLSVMNVSEAREFIGDNTFEGLKDYFVKNKMNTVVTDGRTGAYFFFNHDFVFSAGFEVPTVDTTGAGDIFVAGLIHGLIHQESISRIGQIACFLASKIVSQYGAQLDKTVFQQLDNLPA